MDGPSPLETFDPVDRMAQGYREAQILFTAVRLGVFDALKEGPLAAGELAGRIEADLRGTRILCDALAALGLLVKTGERDEAGAGTYRCSPAAEDFLLYASPATKVPMLLHGAKLYERWAGLFDAVKSGTPVPDDRIDSRLWGDEGGFARAMGVIGRESAVQTADALDRLGLLADVRALLDVGGGPGIYAVEMARRVPGLQAVVLDGAETLEVARGNVEEAGLVDRVTLRPGDAFEDDLGGPYDLVFTSNFLHIFGPEANRGLIRRAADALEPGGHLAVKDFLLDSGRTTPQGAALFAVNMLVGTEAGNSYSVDELHGWFRDAGLDPGETVDLTPQSRLTVGRKA